MITRTAVDLEAIPSVQSWINHPALQYTKIWEASLLGLAPLNTETPLKKINIKDIIRSNLLATIFRVHEKRATISVFEFNTGCCLKRFPHRLCDTERDILSPANDYIF